MVNYHYIDNMEFMAGCQDKQYDIAVIDPPYGIDINKSARLVKDKGEKYKDWDKKIPDPEFFEQLKRVSKHQIIWGGNYFNLGPKRCYLVWDKKQPVDFSFAPVELAWTSYNQNIKMFRWFPQTGNKHRLHPTQKPVALYTWVYKEFAKAGFKILDTHLGSGSSGIAAYDMGLDFDGCENDKEIFERASKRLKQHINRNHLF